MNIYFVEHSHQVENFLSTRDCADGKWIALGPSAMHYLSLRGIRYAIPEDYADGHEIEGICREQFARLQKTSSALDNEMLEEDMLLRQWGIYPFLFHLWQLGMIFDAVVSRTWWIKKILKNHRGGKIYVHEAPVHYWAIYGLGFAKHETLWGRLLMLSEWRDNIVAVKDPGNHLLSDGQISKPGGIRDSLKNIIGSHILLYSAVTSYHLRIKKNIAHLLPPYKKEYTLVLNNSYEWQYILSDLTDSGIPLLFFNENILNNLDYSGSANKKSSEELCQKFFAETNMHGIDCTAMLGDRIQWIIEKAPFLCRAIIKKMEIMCSTIKIKLVLCTSVPSFTNYVVKKFFANKSIPVISYSPGGIWHEKDITQRYDLIEAIGTNILLTFGSAVKESFEHSEMMKDVKVESVGSISLDSINTGIYAGQ